MERIPVALVGLGRIAGLLDDDDLREKPCTHAGAVLDNPDCLLAAGCDLNGERRNLFAQRRGVPVYKDAEEMIRKHLPKILIIATPPDSHARYCELAARAGIPLVICEKPLADTLPGARQIAALEQSGRIRVLVNHERRYSADYLEAQAVLAKGDLGEILDIRGTLYFGRNRRLVSMFWEDGTHLVDAILFLTGSRLIHRMAWGAGMDSREGTAYLGGELEGDPPIPVLLEVGARRDHLVFEVRLSCERGRLVVGNGIFEVWESRPCLYAEGPRSLQKVKEGFQGPTGYFANMLKDGVLCVRDPRRRPRSSAADGLAVIEYLHSVSPWTG